MPDPTNDYAAFLARKAQLAPDDGPAIDTADVHPFLHEWQAEIVQWAVKTGRAAIWADTGLGKTVMSLEWARQVVPGGRVLVLAPLAVCHQTVNSEAPKVGLEARYLRDDDGAPGIAVTNYEMLHNFNPGAFDAVVLDEASILKQSDGRTRGRLIEWARSVKYRLACTATPAPNDPEELTNQAEWLGQMRRVDMLSAYFVHDDTGWRLKGHARDPLMRWMSSWALAIRRPTDLGYPAEGYDLPGLRIVPQIVDTDTVAPEGQLFAADLGGVGGRAKIRKATVEDRVARAVELVNAEPDEPWLMWAGLNAEADMLAAATGAFNVHGSLTPDEKAAGLLGFADGTYKRLVTKPSMAAFGLNWQHCARMVFVGLSDSYEAYYQCIRRCHRYGQSRVVHAHVVLSDMERAIAANVTKKERQASQLTADLVTHMQRARNGRTQP